MFSGLRSVCIRFRSCRTRMGTLVLSKHWGNVLTYMQHWSVTASQSSVSDCWGKGQTDCPWENQIHFDPVSLWQCICDFENQSSLSDGCIYSGSPGRFGKASKEPVIQSEMHLDTFARTELFWWHTVNVFVDHMPQPPSQTFPARVIVQLDLRRFNIDPEIFWQDAQELTSFPQLGVRHDNIMPILIINLLCAWHSLLPLSQGIPPTKSGTYLSYRWYVNIFGFDRWLWRGNIGAISIPDHFDLPPLLLVCSLLSRYSLSLLSRYSCLGICPTAPKAGT